MGVLDKFFDILAAIITGICHIFFSPVIVILLLVVGVAVWFFFLRQRV